MTHRTINTDTIEKNRTALCPSCKSHGIFTYAGEQRVPERVAQAAGMPLRIALWHCTTCKTTLVECELGD